MDSAPAKRRKLDHSGSSSYALQSAASTGLSRSRAFILEVEELLKEVRLDYAIAFEGADGLLHRIKSSLEAIEPHESLAVGIDAQNRGSFNADWSRLPKRPCNLRRIAALGRHSRSRDHRKTPITKYPSQDPNNSTSWEVMFLGA